MSRLSIFSRVIANSFCGAASKSQPSWGPVHVLICICDHYEPGHGNASAEQADHRVANWTQNYPRLFERFRDADGRPPRHTFFYPIEMYRPGEVEQIATLCSQGFGEVEVHLHHDRDTAENLRKTLLDWKKLLVDRHGLLARRRDGGEATYAFIHGNWALNNSRPDGRCCGVDNELDVLYETGCYADFTFPSYPDASQPRRINSIYYAADETHHPLSHERGIAVGAAPPPARELMLIQGPLLPNWNLRKFGLLPRIENGNIQGNQPPAETRLDLWLKASIQIPSRPDWFFVKLHTHGATEANQAVLLGKPMTDFHQSLANRAQREPHFHFHYVTAREMYNLAKAAEGGWTGSVDEARNYQLIAPQTCAA
jgi:hypothetical protein